MGRDLGGHVGRIVAQGHGGGPGVVGLAGDGQLGPRNALNAGHRANGDTLGLEHRALFHVQFYEGPG